MIELIRQYNILYPKFATMPYNHQDCIIKELKVANSDKDLLSLTVNDFSGEQFPYEFAGKTTSFYENSGSIDPMRLSCDGIMFTKINGREALVMCELKSGFDIEQIYHAKEQIVGSFMRLRAQLSILQSYKNCELHGLIVSYLPKTEKLTQIKNLIDRKSIFAKTLYSTGTYEMQASKCKSFYTPIDVPGIHLHYYGVPVGSQHNMISSEKLFADW